MGALGGSQKTTNAVPGYIEEGGKQAIDLAQRIGQMGYVPYIGPEVAAYNPMQQAAAQNMGAAASAFGMGAPASSGVTAPMMTQGGMSGYSSFPGYQAAQEQLAQQYPGLLQYLQGFTIDPVTGTSGGLLSQAAPAPAPDPGYKFDRWEVK